MCTCGSMTALQNTGICIILDSGGCYLQNKYGTRLREGFCKVLRRGGEGALEIFPCSACLPAWLSSTCLRPGRQMNTLRGKPAAAVILRVLFPVGYLRNHSNTPTGIVTSFARAFFTRSRQKRVELHRGALRQSSYVLINGTDSGCLGATSAHGTPCQDRPNERQKAQKGERRPPCTHGSAVLTAVVAATAAPPTTTTTTSRSRSVSHFKLW